MAWNCAVLVVEGAEPTDLAAVGLAPQGEKVLGDHALSSRFAAEAGPGVVAVGPVASGTVVLGEHFSLLELALTAAPALGRTTRIAMFGGASDIYHFQETHPDGAGRELRSVAGELDADSGEPHPAEAGLDLDPLDEDALMNLLERTTGVTFDDALLWAELDLYGPAPAGGAGRGGGPGTAGGAASGQAPSSGDTGPGWKRRSLLDRILGRR